MSEAIWRGLAEKALGGRSLDALASETPEGLRIEPLYTRRRADSGVARLTDGPWAVAQRVDHPDPLEANRLALIDLEGGADALTLVFEGGASRGFGLPVAADAMSTALHGVELDLISLRLDAGASAIEAARVLAALATERRLSSARLSIDLGLDPIGCLARTGVANPLARQAIRDLLEMGRDAGFAGRTFLADGRPYHEAGAGEARELAAVVATGLAYLRDLEAAGLDLAGASAAVAFLLVADADTFVTIAKFRALRRLWARVEEACGLAPRPPRIHAETAWRMMSKRDPWVNVMRATAAVFAAGIGGADVITALPFTLTRGLPEDGARRLARNTHLVLLDEAHLAKVADPAAGSGGFEALTDALCAKAWDMAQEIERQGGIGASLQSGALGAAISETAKRRAEAIATTALGLTGTSTFPILDEERVAVFERPPRPEPTRNAPALPSERDAEPFERLRDRADRIAAETGTRPSVVLATLGPPAAHGPRSTFAVNFFAAGGLATPMLAETDQSDVADAVVCLCGPDALYAERGAAWVQRLKAAGARRVLVAGHPGALEGAWRAAGVDDFIHQGRDALAILDESLRHGP